METWKLIDSTEIRPGRWMCLWTKVVTRAGISTTHHRLTVAAFPLMESPTSVGSAQALAEYGLAAIRVAAPRVLIGGLGFGFTLGAALDRLPATATVVVSELYEAIVRWNREHLYMMEGHRLGDARVRVEVEDIEVRVRSSRGEWDAILLDVDNGPRSFDGDRNDWLYGEAGLAVMRDALVPGGTLAIWSGFDDAKFERRLGSVGFVVARHEFKTSSETAVIWRAHRK